VKIHLFIVLICAACCGAARSDTLAGEGAGDGPRLRLLPDIAFEADLRRFFLQDNPYYRRHYYIESYIYIEPQWVSWNRRLFLSTAFDVSPGMGHTLEDVVFDPMDINFAFTPFLEYRASAVSAQAGLDHRCFHEIDRKDYVTVYWNYLFAAIRSHNVRLDDMAVSAPESAPWHAADRFSWHVQAGWFLRRFFGIVRESSVNYRNNNVFEASGRGRYAFWARDAWVMSAAGKTVMGMWADSAADPERRFYWRQHFSLEASYVRERFGMMLFMSYFLDDVPGFPKNEDATDLQPRFSRDGLLEIGIRVFR
jgi:hypothetical protein